MSLIDSGGMITSGGEKMAEECMPNYQKQAAIMKLKIDNVMSLINAIRISIENDAMPYNIMNKEFTMYELYGFLILQNSSINKEYSRLLEKIEEQKADGSKR